MHARVNSGDVVRSAGLDQNSLSEVTELRHEWQDIPLQEGFASGDFHQRTVKSQHPLNDFRQSHLSAGVKCIGRITIGAAQIAKRQPHEDAR